MKYRTLGRSGVKVSCLALGGNIFGHFCNRRETEALIHAAGDLGINLIDTADVYGDGRSEEFIGWALRNGRAKWILATKVGVPSGHSPWKTGNRQTIFHRVEQSLRRLRTDYIDVYQMHHYDPQTPLEETLSALDLLVKQGKVRFIGVSNYSSEQLSQALALASNYHLAPISAIQTSYNLFKRQAEADFFGLCRQKHVAVLAYGALGRGILSGKYHWRQTPPPASRASTSTSIRADLTESVLQTVSRLNDFARSQGWKVADLALVWALRRPEVTSLLVGVRNIAQLMSNVEAVNWKLSETDLNAIDCIVGPPDKFSTVSMGRFS